MRFLSKPKPKPQPLCVIREWIGNDGEEWVGIHPVFRAISEAWFPAGDLPFRFVEEFHRLLGEVVDGERRFPKELGDRVLEFDEEQQTHGAPDENLGQLVELLEGRFA